MIVTATELKTNLGKYFELATIQDIFITKNGKNIARLTSPSIDKLSVLGSLVGIVSVLFFFTVGANLHLLNVHAAEVSKLPSEEAVQSVLEDYFADFLDTMSADSSRDYLSDDFATINGYIAAKYLVAKREGNKILLNGIQAVSLEEVVLEDLLEKDGFLEATAYVKYEYSWGSGSKEDTCRAGSLYQVTLTKSNEGYKVLDLDDIDNEEVQMAKDSIYTSARNSEDIYQRVDAYFDKIQQNAKDMTEAVIDRNTIEEDENYIFKRAAEDYTNFVSQCVLAGYGGTDGYHILNSPFINDAVCVV